jgi:hypothetical protein
MIHALPAFPFRRLDKMARSRLGKNPENFFFLTNRSTIDWLCLSRYPGNAACANTTDERRNG